MTFPSSQPRTKCPDHEETELLLTFTDKYGIEHEHIQYVCFNCQDQITFQTSGLQTPDIDIPTLELAISYIKQRKPTDPLAMLSKQAYQQCISDIESLKRKAKHPEFQR